jgi:hypothetical protein
MLNTEQSKCELDLIAKVIPAVVLLVIQISASTICPGVHTGFLALLHFSDFDISDILK